MKRAIIVATGPSLVHSDIDLIKKLKWPIIAVNNAYMYFKKVDILYACDYEWWETYLPDIKTKIKERWTTNEQAAKRYGLHHIPGEHWEQQRKVFDISGYGIVYGGNSGFQSLNLAYARGVRDAVLVGFNMGYDRDKEAKHCHGEHPPHIDKPSPFPYWIECFNRAAPVIKSAGMRVRNATRNTRLECFPKISLKKLANEL